MVAHQQSPIQPIQAQGILELQKSLIWLLVVLALSVCIHVRLLPYADDDAYIHMRVAEHLWSMGKPYFNISDPVMSSTSPLWVLITSPCALFGRNQAFIVGLLNSALVLIAGILWAKVYRLIFAEATRTQTLAAAVVSSLTLLPSSVGLMETPLAMCLVALGYLGCLRGRWWGSSSLVAAIFVRPEVIVYALIVRATLSKECAKDNHTKSSISDLSLAVLLCLAALSVQHYFFGSIVPHTALVKTAVYQVNLQEFIRLLSIAAYGDICARILIPAVVLLTCIVVVVSIARAPTLSLKRSELWREYRLASALLLPAIVILAAYAAKHVLVFSWYSPLFLTPIHLGFLRLCCHRDPIRRALAFVLLTPLFVMSAQVLLGCISPRCLPFFQAGARARQLRIVAGALQRHVPEATVVAPEIGAIGYEFSGTVSDAIGLATPRALQYHPLSVPGQRPSGFHGGVPAAFIAAVNPDIVIGLDALMQDVITSPLIAQYELFKLSPVNHQDLVGLANGTVFGSRHLLVLIRRPLAVGWSVERLSGEKL